MTKEFFQNVCQIPTVSGHEELAVDFIRRWARGNRCRFRQDSTGNVYLTKGSAKFFNCCCGHIDTVHKDQQDLIDKKIMKKLVWKGDIVTAENPDTGKQTGLGADDLCGVAISLAVLQRLPAGKAVFTVKEELGCVGAKSVDPEFFKDVAFIAGTDSPDSNRATRYSDGVLLCGDGFFEEYVKPICAKHGVTSFRSEPLCDCNVYRKIDFGGKRIECGNFGNGGYDPHMNTEYAKFSEVCNAEDLVLDLCRTIPSDRQWTSDYREEEKKDWWSRYEPASRTDVYSQWSNSFRRPVAVSAPKQAEFDFERSGSDKSFLWVFRGGEPVAKTFVDRVGRLLSPDTKVEKAGKDSAKVTGPENRLKTAFRFAYNYDNGTRFWTWEDFVKAVPTAEKEFERALSEFDDGDGAELSPMEHSDSDECSISLEFKDPELVPQYLKALSNSKLDVDPEDDGEGNVSLYGELKDVKEAFRVKWNVENGVSYRTWGEFVQEEPIWSDLFWDDVVFPDDYVVSGDDYIDAEWTED